MATKKRANRKIKRRRVNRKSTLPLTKLDQHYIALRECFLSARRAGFTSEEAFWLLNEMERTAPNWVVGDGNIIPVIDPTEEDED